MPDGSDYNVKACGYYRLPADSYANIDMSRMLIFAAHRRANLRCSGQAQAQARLAHRDWQIDKLQTSPPGPFSVPARGAGPRSQRFHLGSSCHDQ